VGPYIGLEQIARATPRQVIVSEGGRSAYARDGEVDVARFGWDAGGGGTLRLAWRDGAIAALTVAFGE
jgi:hypothetical protein